MDHVAVELLKIAKELMSKEKKELISSRTTWKDVVKDSVEFLQSRAMIWPIVSVKYVDGRRAMLTGTPSSLASYYNLESVPIKSSKIVDVKTSRNEARAVADEV